MSPRRPKSQAAGPSVALGGISRAPPTLEQLSADKELLAKWTSKADRGPPGDLLVALSEAASVFVSECRSTRVLGPAGQRARTQPRLLRPRDGHAIASPISPPVPFPRR